MQAVLHVTEGRANAIACCDIVWNLRGIVCAISVFFFSSRRRHTRFDCDWSSDVCSSDLTACLILSCLSFDRIRRRFHPLYFPDNGGGLLSITTSISTAISIHKATATSWLDRKSVV